MKLVARPIDLEVGGKYVVILNKDDADNLGIRASDRVCINYNGKNLTAIVDTTIKFTVKGEIIANDDVTRFFDLKGGEHLDIEAQNGIESAHNDIRLIVQFQ